ncbi:Heavy metal-associated isoprenylated plant protein 26 [Platanthera zijinensis]|uniref:Heavy metal-associated isoprenylated plant protein 26 n=1 Tax=Platanthera zijinensis TaxID=2320716 RepID=A0AAP0B4S0_9ASPA
MASNISIDFQSINFFPCSASSSSTSASTSSVLSHGRAIDRHSPHLIDPLREKYSARFHSRSKPCEQKSKNVEEKSPQPVSPATSSRYLLHGDISAIDHYFSDAESFPSLRFECLKEEDFCVVNSPSPPRKTDQVVVLSVSLHCKGCERKIRKHISKMKGVTSFTTDLTTKKVTVTGDLTPASVLNSISKVKKAQFWPSS